MTSNILKYCKIIALCIFFFIIFFSLPPFCNGHDHDSDHHHHDHHHEHEPSPAYKYSREANSQTGSEQQRPKKQIRLSSLWIQALSSTLIISIAPFLVLFIVPINSKREHKSLLKILLSFASGGLLGDAFLHLIPHALEPHSHMEPHQHTDDHSHSHSHGNTGAWVLGGILAFLIVEKGVRLIKGEHSHGHLHADVSDVDDKETEKDEKTTDEKEKEVATVDNSDSMSESEDEIQIAGYLNLVADFAHNLTDGLAIGASYLAGETVGLVTTITVLLHEVPHEIGDFAILVQSGCSKKKAMLLQLITAFGALLGTVVSLISGGVDASKTSWALPFTAGGFIYISTVSIIPELLTDSTFKQSIKEIGALLAGVGLMVLVAQFE